MLKSNNAPAPHFPLDDISHFPSLRGQESPQFIVSDELDLEGDLFDGFGIEGIVLDQSQNSVFGDLFHLVFFVVLLDHGF